MLHNLLTLRKAKGMLNLTKDDILNDIKGYEERIRKAQNKLSGLPGTVPTTKERKKIKDKRRVLLTEIDQVRGFISIAEEALNQSSSSAQNI